MRLGYEYMKDTHLHQPNNKWVSDLLIFSVHDPLLGKSVHQWDQELSRPSGPYQ